MKTIDKKQSTIDPMALAREYKNFDDYLDLADSQIKLANIVFKRRKEMVWTQDKLAEEIKTTQRIISNIESGDVNVGMGLLRRLVKVLMLSNEDLGVIFDSCVIIQFNNDSVSDYQFPSFSNIPSLVSIKNNNK